MQQRPVRQSQVLRLQQVGAAKMISTLKKNGLNACSFPLGYELLRRKGGGVGALPSVGVDALTEETP
jgi:hypothetical protein